MQSGEQYFNLSEYTAESADIPVVSDYLQIGRGETHVYYKNRSFGDVSLRSYMMKRTTLEDFRILDGWTTFTLSAIPSSHAQWNNVSLCEHVLAVLMPGEAHSALIPADWGVIEIDVDDHVLEREGLVDYTRRAMISSPQAPHIRLSSTDADAARATLTNILDSGASGSDTRRCNQIFEVLHQLFGAEVHGSPPDIRQKSAAVLVRKARKIIAETDARSLTVSSLCDRLNSTPRRMQRSFKEAIGVTPKQYLISWRLDQARQHLSPHQSITRVAEDFGFCSQSRFTEHFRRQYGVTPSDCIARMRKTAM